MVIIFMIINIVVGMIMGIFMFFNIICIVNLFVFREVSFFLCLFILEFFGVIYILFIVDLKIYFSLLLCVFNISVLGLNFIRIYIRF